MTNPIISAEHLSKRYELRHQTGEGDGLRCAIERAIRNPVRWFEEHRQRKLAARETFWALKDVSFEVNQGDVVGIIGRNGSGKSTLLKILSQITEPTTGRVTLEGRVASLLEVGTGFHPELTGRENIFLNGAILGMHRREIAAKFDEIVDFAEIEKFLDTPVKRYSSGMYVRLAFAVAAHLEPEILLIDEVLAVGDAQFQQKCLGKMDSVAQDGRTVLFVSHSEAAVRRLCTKAILLQAGAMVYAGSPSEAYRRYRKHQAAIGFTDRNRIHSCDEIRITDAALALDGAATDTILSASRPEIILQIEVRRKMSVSFEIMFRDANANPILFAPTGLANGLSFDLSPGSYEVAFQLHLPYLAEGSYSLDLMVAEPGVRFFDYVKEALQFTISTMNHPQTGWEFKQSRGQGCILLETSRPIIRRNGHAAHADAVKEPAAVN